MSGWRSATQSFWARSSRHEIRFGKDDRLRAEVWFRQWETESGELHTERVITRVDAHLAAPVQVGFLDQDGRVNLPDD